MDWKRIFHTSDGYSTNMIDLVPMQDAEAEIEKAWMRGRDQGQGIREKARMEGYDQGLRHGKTFARTDRAVDVAGEVWDMLVPYLKLGTHVELYDKIRERFPQVRFPSICESCGKQSSLRERWTSMEGAGPLDLNVCSACAYHLKDAHWSNGPRTRKE